MFDSKISVNLSAKQRLKALDLLFRLVLIRIYEPFEMSSNSVLKLEHLLVGIKKPGWGLIFNYENENLRKILTQYHFDAVVRTSHSEINLI